ncbi:MarR family transcriptional regulator [Novosphingopyxis sp.]|uniref:MarR family transcriptional regulator n=1 Tax=Novosphingopyxis sp. TaxID=2709690 RepID=UPI003B5BDDF2
MGLPDTVPHINRQPFQSTASRTAGPEDASDKDATLDQIIGDLEAALHLIIDRSDAPQKSRARHLLRRAKRYRDLTNNCQAALGAQFQNPPFAILLELFILGCNGKSAPVKNICLAACSSQSTALRWVQRLVDQGLIERTHDREDARRVLLNLTCEGETALIKLLGRE